MTEVQQVSKAIRSGCQVRVKGIGNGNPLRARWHDGATWVEVRFFYPHHGAQWVRYADCEFYFWGMA